MLLYYRRFEEALWSKVFGGRIDNLVCRLTMLRVSLTLINFAVSPEQVFFLVAVDMGNGL